jgi:hypothetical protein
MFLLSSLVPIAQANATIGVRGKVLNYRFSSTFFNALPTVV